MAYRISSLYEKFSEDIILSDDVILEDEALWNQIIEYDLISLLPDGLIKVAPEDYSILMKATRQQKKDSQSDPQLEIKNKSRIIDALYHTNVGRAVLKQIKKWNYTRYFCAIRDNIPGNDVPNDKTQPRWQAFESNNPKWLISQTSHLVPEYFGYVNQGELYPGFFTWLTAHNLKQSIDFRTKITLEESCKFRIQVIGQPVKIIPKPSQILPCEKNYPDASNIVFSLSKGTHDLCIKANPIHYTETYVRGLNICIKNNKLAWKKSGLTLAAPSVKPLTLTTSDGVILSNGKNSSFCIESGLHTLIGYMNDLKGSLYDLLAKSKRPDQMNTIGLTIDSQLQKISQNVLRQKIDEYQQKNLSDKKLSKLRRASVVIIDISSGDILAVAGLPQPVSNLHPWDVATYSKAYHQENPFIIRAWQGLDRHSAPGSTFKPVTALSAMDVADQLPKIGNYIKGFTKDEFPKSSGLTLDCAAYQPQTGQCFDSYSLPLIKDYIRNFKRHEISRYFGFPSSNVCSGIFKSSQIDFGLRQAIMHSVNVWFVRLGVLVDGDAAKQFDLLHSRNQTPFPDFKVSAIAKRLGFGDIPFDLGKNIPFNIQHRRVPFIKRVQEGDVLYAKTGNLDLMDQKRVNYLWILSQNCIGQGVTASPLQMARIAASIAKGEIVMPGLFHHFGSMPATRQNSQPLNISKKWLNFLKEGMHAVPQMGTATQAFNNYNKRCFVYGKTGTANVGIHKETQKKIYTAWFIGWYQPENSIKNAFAFSCMVTHTYGRQYTGGKICAPIIKEILSNIQD